MAEDEDDLGTEDGCAVFEAGDYLGRGHVAGDAGDEDVSDTLIEEDLDGDARVGAGEHGGEGLLLVDGVVAQDFHVLVEAAETAGDIALAVSIKEGFQGIGVVVRLAFGEGGWRRRSSSRLRRRG